MRPRVAYTSAERRFSQLLRQRLAELLQGKRNQLEILRKYPRDSSRLGIIPTPPGFPLGDLRFETIEALTWDTLRFIKADGTGGPIAQFADCEGAIVGVQTFPTRYPHIVIDRIDSFSAEEGGLGAESITWRLTRVQNQHAQTKLNRLLDATNLLFEIARLVR